ncbi:MAG TPA: L-histidine N(alpha)-methyltransferase [Gemmatimonadaceae bacterium]
MTSPARAGAARPTGERAMLADVREGLSRAQKELSPKYFYDERGSELFEAITRLPEYYLTRTERAMLRALAPELVAAIHPRTIVELGAGSAEKTRILLDAACRAADRALTYVPVDVSAEFLDRTATRLREAYPALDVRPVVADITTDIVLPALRHPVLHVFLGSTIGNFETPAAVRLLRRIRSAMRDGDRLLLGADLRKAVPRIEAAYNDRAGITAEFNRNVLRVLNRELGADFDVDAFRHRAIYDRDRHRIEMHLVADAPQQVTVPGVGVVRIARGESIRTEISTKYDRPAIEAMFAAAGLDLADWRTDPDGLFALALGARAA